MKTEQTILIVDDEVSNVLSLASAFTQQYRVLFALNGQDALAIAHQEHPDLIILDIMMPDMTGYSVLSRIKTDQQLHHIPVILASSSEDVGDEKQGLELGAADFWSKPINPEVAKIRAHNTLELKRHRDQLQTQTLTDALCDIANRRAFDRSLHKEWQNALQTQQPLSLLMIDIDYFKRYNDHYGHIAGDTCLKTVASILKNSLAEANALLCRYGGEEFAVILPNISTDIALKIAESLRIRVEESQIQNIAINATVSVSIGCATALPSQQQSSSNTQDSLVFRADQALYQGDCSPPFRARLPTSQAATGAWPDLRKPPLAGTDSPSAFSLITPCWRILIAALMSRSSSTEQSEHAQVRTDNSRVSTLCPQQEQVLELANHWSILTRCLPCA
ncbi:diguanylate cyclase (GGDEF) domain-containing protein, partial [Oceanospirillum multiglobuliferum]